MAYFHGVNDAVVPIEQSQFAYNVFLKQARHPQILHRTFSMGLKFTKDGEKIKINNDHSLNMFFRAFRPNEADSKAILKHQNTPESLKYTQHLDHIFMRSHSFVPTDFFVNV